MSRQTVLRLSMIVGLATVVAGMHVAAKDPELKEHLAVNAKLRRDLAMRTYTNLHDRRAELPESIQDDFFYKWSVKWLEAERDLSQSRADEIAACESHLKRMQADKERVAALFRNAQVASYTMDMAEFYRLEAEDWLSAAKARK